MAFHANIMASGSIFVVIKNFPWFWSNFPPSKQLFTRLAMHSSKWWWWHWYKKWLKITASKKSFLHLKKKLGRFLLKGLFWLFLRFCWLFCTPVVVDSERLLQWEFLEVLLAPNWYFMSREREEEGKFHLSIVQSRAARKSAQFSVMKAFCAWPPRSIFLDCEKSKQLNLNSNLRKQLSHFLWNLQGANHVNQQMLLVFVYQKHSFIWRILFENHPKCLISILPFLPILTNFCPLKM